MQSLFEGGYYFASLFVKCGVYSRATTKQHAASIQANMVIVKSVCLSHMYLMCIAMKML